MTMTDLGVECMVGLCMAAAIWWVARRRCRTHTEEPKTRFESVDPAKAMPLVDDASAAAAEEDALLAEGDTSERTPHDETDAQLDDGVASLHSLVERDQQSRDLEDEDEDVDEEDDDAAETDVTEHDVDDQDEEDEEYVEEEEEVPMDDQMKEALARAEAMAATMGVNAFGNMTESVMAMEEFLVLDAPLSPAQPGTEAERMQMEDPAPIEAQHAQDEVENAAEELEQEQEQEQEQDDDDLVTVDYVEEDDEAKPPAAAPPTATSEGEASGVMSAFWAKCENKDECSLCNTSFSFLVRRHHCRKCRASVCGGCSANSAALAEFGGSVERVCDRCWATMQMAAADHHGDVLQDEEEKPLSS